MKHNLSLFKVVFFTRRLQSDLKFCTFSIPLAACFTCSCICAFALTVTLLVMCHRDAEGLDKASEILKSLGLQPSREDCEVVQQVCIAVSTRSAHLCAAGLATITNRIRNNRGLRNFDTTVAVDGTVYNEHPK